MLPDALPQLIPPLLRPLLAPSVSLVAPQVAYPLHAHVLNAQSQRLPRAAQILLLLRVHAAQAAETAVVLIRPTSG